MDRVRDEIFTPITPNSTFPINPYCSCSDICNIFQQKSAFIYSEIFKKKYGANFKYIYPRFWKRWGQIKPNSKEKELFRELWRRFYGSSMSCKKYVRKNMKKSIAMWSGFVSWLFGLIIKRCFMISFEINLVQRCAQILLRCTVNKDIS